VQQIVLIVHILLKDITTLQIMIDRMPDHYQAWAFYTYYVKPRLGQCCEYWHDVDCKHLVQNRGQGVGCCEHGNEASGSIKGGGFWL